MNIYEKYEKYLDGKLRSEVPTEESIVLSYRNITIIGLVPMSQLEDLI
jgi:hypothetical protein